MIKGVTSTGFVFEIDERVHTDFRLVELNVVMINGTEEQQAFAMVNLLKLIFKDDGEALKKHVAEQNDGYIPAEALMEEVGEILMYDETTKK